MEKSGHFGPLKIRHVLRIQKLGYAYLEKIFELQVEVFDFEDWSGGSVGHCYQPRLPLVCPNPDDVVSVWKVEVSLDDVTSLPTEGGDGATLQLVTGHELPLSTARFPSASTPTSINAVLTHSGMDAPRATGRQQNGWSGLLMRKEAQAQIHPNLCKD